MTLILKSNGIGNCMISEDMVAVVEMLVSDCIFFRVIERNVLSFGLRIVLSALMLRYLLTSTGSEGRIKSIAVMFSVPVLVSLNFLSVKVWPEFMVVE